MASSNSNNENISPLAAFAPLYSLALLVPSAYPATGSGSGSGREDEGNLTRGSFMSAVWMGVVRKAHGISCLVLRPKNLICIVLSELDKESAARFGLEYFARIPGQKTSEITGRRNPPAPEQASETMAAEVRVLKAELAKARANAAAAVTLAEECAAVPVMTRGPGVSLANPNKAACRVTAVELQVTAMMRSVSFISGRFLYLWMPESVAGLAPVAIDVILAFLLTDGLLGVLQLLEQRQIEPDVWL
ncbi:hypothetical protein V8E52_010591 [Russula decolorans]